MYGGITKKRQKLIEELQPLLVEPDIVQIQKNRALPDAFTDLLIRQGNDIPVLSPKKWKVWWLTLIGLFFTLLWTRDALPFYYEKWNLDTAHPRVLGLVSVFISTFINSYIMTPLLLFLFSNWLIRLDTENDTKLPWRVTNDGFESLWAKLALSILMYGGFAIAWAIRVHT